MDKITELLTRGVDAIYPTRDELEKVLRSGKKLTLYQGFDPTGTQLHIGHMVGFRKLRQWQDLGHKVIFLIGDGTGQAGDPSGKTKSRDKFFTTEELRKNATDYVKQASKIVRFEGENAIEIRYNGDWLNKLNLTELLNLAGHFTLQQLIERDLFQERMKKGEDVNMREFLYPLLQGYDSVAMAVDLEIGGSDQMFNMLAGRKLVREILNKEKFVLTTPLLTDSEGKKIGKTEGNVIALTDKPEDLYGKIMALPDDVVGKAFEYLTDIPMDEVKQIVEAVQNGNNPIVHKKRLAYEITKQLNDQDSAAAAQTEFENRVQKKELVLVGYNSATFGLDLIEIVSHVAEGGIVLSKSDAKRRIEQGGVEINGKRITDPKTRVSKGEKIKIGKFVFIEVQ